MVSTSFLVKVNRKARRSALRGALSAHAQAGTLGLVDGSLFTTPSTKQAAAVVAAWGKSTPIVVVGTEDEESMLKSFRNLEGVVVTLPSELDVAAVVWARSLIVSEAALPFVQGRAA